MPKPPQNLSLFSDNGETTPDDPFFYEKLARQAGYGLIAGVDEVGRGPLAGPVVAAAVIIPSGVELAGVDDSKRMKEKAREEAFPEIHRNATAMAIGVVSHYYIDEHNILNASLEAMKQAVSDLHPQPEILLVDGIHKVPIPITQWCIKKGDQRSRSISAASVVAKVYRDRIMRCYHQAYPFYGFHTNKGYGTRMHLEALQAYGHCPYHRRTFKGVCDLTRDRLELGKRGEELAYGAVKRLGYKGIVRNYRCPLGEVDLIAKDGDTLVFMEIKTRRGRDLGYAKEAVNAKKKRQLSKVALFYMKSEGCCDVRARFDVVAISLERGKPKVELIKNAFDLAY